MEQMFNVYVVAIFYASLAARLLTRYCPKTPHCPKMPRTYVPKGLLQLDRSGLEKAFNYRVETGCSLKDAAEKYDVKIMTLQDAFGRSRKKSDGQTFVPIEQRVNRVFLPEQENRLVEYAMKIARMFYGLTIVEFLKLIYTYAVACGSKAIPEAWETGQKATRDWYYVFMKRHPTLTLKTPEGMSIARIIAFNRTNVDLFFRVYAEAMDKYSFTPDRIFNLDESSLTTVMKPVKVVCERGKPVASQISRERGASMTFVGIINAAGTFLPPVFIIPRKRWNDSFMRGTIDGSKGLLHQNGWMNGELFLETLRHIQRRTYCSPDNKILLIMDNAECHMNIHAVEYAIENGIVIVTLPPHTTAKLQPLDVSIFGPFKFHMRALQNDFHLMHPSMHITEHSLPELACKAWIRACTPANVMSGFRATGIWPIDSHIFPDEAFAGSEVTDLPPPEIAAEEQGLDVDLDETLPPSPIPSTSSCTTPAPSDRTTPAPSDPTTPGPSTSTTPVPSYPTTPGPSTSTNPRPLDISPEDIRPYPKVAARPLAKGRKKVKACILTENDEALFDLRAKEEKKRKAEEKKGRVPKVKKSQLPKPVAEEEDSEEDQALVLDDSSEFSDEVLEDPLDTPASYPFQDKEPEDKPSMEQSCFKHPRLAPSSMSVSPEPIADHEAEPVGDPKPIIYFKAEPIADPEPIIDIKDEPIEDPEPIIDIEPIEDPLHIIDHKTEPVADPEHNNLEAECSTLMLSTGPLGNSTDVGKATFTPCSDLQVGEEIVEMTTTLLTAPHNQSKLQAINKKLSQKVDELEERLANLTGHIQRVYNEDQISAVTRKSTLGHKWSTETIQKARQIRLACGDGGYETLLGMGFPFPALKTLRRITEESKVCLDHSCDIYAEFSSETRPPLLVGLARVPHPDDVTSK